LQVSGPAHGVDHQVGAEPGELADRLDRIGLAGVDGVRGAEFRGPVEFPVVDVHGDDPGRAAESGADGIGAEYSRDVHGRPGHAMLALTVLILRTCADSETWRPHR